MLRLPCDLEASMDQERFLLPATDAPPPEPLRDGAKVILFQPGKFEVEAETTFDATAQRWVGTPDWATIRHLPTKAGVARATTSVLASVVCIVLGAIAFLFFATLVAMSVHSLHNRLLGKPTGEEFFPDRAFVIILVQTLAAGAIALPVATWYIGRQTRE